MAGDPAVMPKTAPHLMVEEVYHAYWGKVGGVGRLRRSFSLFADFWEMLEFQVRKKHPEASGASSSGSLQCSGYFINEQAIHDAIAAGTLFQAIDEASMVKIDFHVGEMIPGELERTSIHEISQGMILPLVSKEDAILSKLLWIQKGSHTSRHDVIEMLKRDEDLDRACLGERAATLGILDLLAELERDMREARDHGPQPRHT